MSENEKCIGDLCAKLRRTSFKDYKKVDSLSLDELRGQFEIFWDPKYLEDGPCGQWTFDTAVSRANYMIAKGTTKEASDKSYIQALAEYLNDDEYDYSVEDGCEGSYERAIESVIRNKIQDDIAYEAVNRGYNGAGRLYEIMREPNIVRKACESFRCISGLKQVSEDLTDEELRKQFDLVKDEEDESTLEEALSDWQEYLVREGTTKEQIEKELVMGMARDIENYTDEGRSIKEYVYNGLTMDRLSTQHEVNILFEALRRQNLQKQGGIEYA